MQTESMSTLPDAFLDQVSFSDLNQIVKPF